MSREIERQRFSAGDGHTTTAQKGRDDDAEGGGGWTLNRLSNLNRFSINNTTFLTQQSLSHQSPQDYLLSSLVHFHFTYISLVNEKAIYI